MKTYVSVWGIVNIENSSLVHDGRIPIQFTSIRYAELFIRKLRKSQDLRPIELTFEGVDPSEVREEFGVSEDPEYDLNKIRYL